MASDPRSLRPSELCRLLNSTPLGEVINERQLHRHRTRAGLRIGDARHVDLLRYAAWLVGVRHTPKPTTGGDPYETVKDRARARNIALSLAGRDIGDLPLVKNPERKERAASNFRFFCDNYFPLTFHLPWSKDHLKVIGRIEQAVLRGGLFAMAMPRGSGKSTISECACIWAVLFGLHFLVSLFVLKTGIVGYLANWASFARSLESVPADANRNRGRRHRPWRMRHARSPRPWPDWLPHATRGRTRLPIFHSQTNLTFVRRYR